MGEGRCLDVALERRWAAAVTRAGRWARGRPGRAVGLFSAEPPFRVRQRFECPVRGRAVTADFAVSQGAGQPASVVYCSAFSDPTRVTCAQRCLDAATVRWAPPVGVFAGWALTSGGVVGANGSAAQVAGRTAE